MVFSLITRFARSVPPGPRPSPHITRPFLRRHNCPPLTHHSNVCCFLYPAYASYKALSARPESSDESARQVERWLMYWSVVGSWTAVEAVVGWSFTWCVSFPAQRDAVALICRR